jgi:hypothetical protein
VPATAANILSGVRFAKGNLGGPQQVFRAAHTICDPTCEHLLVVVQFLLVGVTSRTHGRSRRMRVGGRDHDMIRRYAARFLDQAARLDTDAAMKADKITDHHRESGLASVEHEAACMQFVMHVETGIRGKAAYPQSAQRRSDVARRCSSSEITGFVRFRGPCIGEGQNYEQGAEKKRFHGLMPFQF